MLARLICLAALILVLAAAPAAFPGPVHAGEGEAAANAKARLEAARKMYEGTLRLYKTGPPVPLDVEKLYRWSRRWLKAQHELATKKEDRVAAAEAHLTRMRSLEKTLRQMLKSREVPAFEVAGAEFYRLEAERWVAKAKGE